MAIFPSTSTTVLTVVVPPATVSRSETGYTLLLLFLASTLVSLLAILVLGLLLAAKRALELRRTAAPAAVPPAPTLADPA